jgi:uncharacterized protein with HEPN domain
MQQPRDASALFDIFTQSQLIRDFVHGIVEGDFRHDAMRQMAIIRALEVIGEAVNRLSGALCARHPEVEWRSWINFRNVLIHAYDRVDSQIVWISATREIPVLKRQVSAIYREVTGDAPPSFKV